jgi:hypothetical protein
LIYFYQIFLAEGECGGEKLAENINVLVDTTGRSGISIILHRCLELQYRY